LVAHLSLLKVEKPPSRSRNLSGTRWKYVLHKFPADTTG